MFAVLRGGSRSTSLPTRHVEGAGQATHPSGEQVGLVARGYDANFEAPTVMAIVLARRDGRHGVASAGQHGHDPLDIDALAWSDEPSSQLDRRPMVGLEVGLVGRTVIAQVLGDSVLNCHINSPLPVNLQIPGAKYTHPLSRPPMLRVLHQRSIQALGAADGNESTIHDGGV